MKTVNSPNGAQGAAMEQTTYAPILNNVIRVFGWLVLILTLLQCFSPLFSQSYDTLDVSLHNFQIIAPEGTLQQGDSATFEIRIGTSAEPISDATWFDIELTLSENAEFPSDPTFDFVDSWLLTPSVADTQEITDSDAGTIRLLAGRTDHEAQSGHGILFRVTLVSDANGVAASSLITSGGGLLEVVDIGYKTDPALEVDPLMAPVMFPNPCREKVRFDWKGQTPEQVHLLSMRGEVITLSAGVIGRGEVDTSNLTPGIYKVVMAFETGKMTQTLVVSQ